MTLKNLMSRPRLALLGASGMIAAAAFAGTTMMSHATAPPQPNTPATEAPAATTEKPDVNEPSEQGAGHTDEARGATTDSNVNHEFDGVE